MAQGFIQKHVWLGFADSSLEGYPAKNGEARTRAERKPPMRIELFRAFHDLYYHARKANQGETRLDTAGVDAGEDAGNLNKHWESCEGSQLKGWWAILDSDQ